MKRNRQSRGGIICEAATRRQFGDAKVAMTAGYDGGVNNNGVRVKAAGCGLTKKKNKKKTVRQEGETGGKLRKKRSTLGEELTKAVRGVGPGRLGEEEVGGGAREERRRRGTQFHNIVIIFFLPTFFLC